MSNLAQSLEHIAQARALLITQFKGSASLGALLDSYIQQVQLLENAAFDVLNSRTVESASDAQLDLLGKLVGQPRNGMEDKDYRLCINARIAINVGSGTADQLLNLFILLGETPSIYVTPPASFYLYMPSISSDTAASYAPLVAIAKAAAVASAVVYSTIDDAHTFTFSDNDTEQSSTTQGWADDAQTTGGQLADVV